jgi:hypothetical protein
LTNIVLIDAYATSRNAAAAISSKKGLFGDAGVKVAS